MFKNFAARIPTYWPSALLAISCLLCSGSSSATEQRELRIYNWSDYIDAELLVRFEAETGIKVVYDTYDSNLEVEQIILKGGQGYDLVVPSIDFMGKQLKKGYFQRLDTARLKNYPKLDPKLMKQVSELDIQNAHGIPYMWGTTGIGYNINKVREVLGADAPTDSWSLVFNPANVAKLSACGVSVIDAPYEVFAAAVNYLGRNPNSPRTQDYQDASEKLLKKIAPYISINASDYNERLAQGDLCVVIGYSGDIYQAMAEAAEGVELAYAIPREGAQMWVDMLAIPELARNVDEAHEFIDFLLRPDVAAANTNYIWYPNPVLDSIPLIDKEITSDKSIYPTPQVLSKLYTGNLRKAKVRRVIEDGWNEVMEISQPLSKETGNAAVADQGAQPSS
ncbi:extracellular solute-binding protein [Pseudomaricurvus sp. HS19]|uniref:extracellular solute-binding protein n=1 Tax=Pseudomaricurvus sp. HS19 TaxID=2692626 RepID=UPI0013706577|nr:extracellular solute-binding protein [Pseudomaricurvus sp. HS19]MYM64241.1 extracellular solute-binding protein [Pseudomaricurvus sp. HS19]